MLWSPAEALERYRQAGGRITDPTYFGTDPLMADNSKLEMREQAFRARFPSFEPVFHTLVNGNGSMFQEGLLFLCDVTYRLSCS